MTTAQQCVFSTKTHGSRVFCHQLQVPQSRESASPLSPLAATKAMPLNLMGQMVLRDCTACVYRVTAYICDTKKPLSPLSLEHCA